MRRTPSVSPVSGLVSRAENFQLAATTTSAAARAMAAKSSMRLREPRAHVLAGVGGDGVDIAAQLLYGPGYGGVVQGDDRDHGPVRRLQRVVGEVDALAVYGQLRDAAPAAVYGRERAGERARSGSA